MDYTTYMCEEIMIEILSRLPAKPLIRSMAVCQLWKSIITSPQFRLDSKRPSKLLVHTDRGFYTLVEDSEEEKRLIYEMNSPLMIKSSSHDSVEVIGSDNGLLCIGMISKFCVIIWNPFIRKHVVIPDHHMDDVFTVTTEYASGFGGTISGGDYKYVSVVGFRDGGGSLKKVVDSYSLKAGTWRRKYPEWDIGPGVGGKKNITFALLKGRLHWIGGRTNKVISFELEDEVLENKIMVPESILSSSGIYVDVNVAVIRESLAVITNEIRFQGRSSVWVMEEYGDVNSWVNLFNIGLDFLCRVEKNMVHLLKNGELLFVTNKQKLVTCNPKTMKTCDFGGGLLSSLSKVRGFTLGYKESLMLLGDHRAVGNQPTQRGHSKYGYNPARTGGACSYPLV